MQGESETIRYLNSIGETENVYPVADPAFLMDPKQPKNGYQLRMIRSASVLVP